MKKFLLSVFFVVTLIATSTLTITAETTNGNISTSFIYTNLSSKDIYIEEGGSTIIQLSTPSDNHQTQYYLDLTTDNQYLTCFFRRIGGGISRKNYSLEINANNNSPEHSKLTILLKNSNNDLIMDSIDLNIIVNPKKVETTHPVETEPPINITKVPEISISPDPIITTAGTMKEVKITLSHNDGSYYLSESHEEDCIECTWSKRGDYENILIIIAKDVGTSILDISLLDKYGDVVSILSTTVTVQEKTYIITFDSNGGNGTPADMSKTKGQYIYFPSYSLIRDGYKFLGWSCDVNDSSAKIYEPGEAFLVDRDVTFIAVWAKEYKIIFDANGGGVTPADIVKSEGQDIYIPSYSLTRDGYKFLGWSYDVSDSNAKLYKPGEVFSEDMDVTFTAVWVKESDTISGACGDTAEFSLDPKTGVLKIIGSGAIWENAFNKESSDSVITSEQIELIKNVYIGGEITEIGCSAFRGMENLQKVLFTDTLKNINSLAFAYCTSLKNIEFPVGLEYICSNAFDGCVKIEELTIPSTVVSLGTYSFYDTNMLKKVYFGGSPSQWKTLTENLIGFSDSITVYYGMEDETNYLAIIGDMLPYIIVILIVLAIIIVAVAINKKPKDKAQSSSNYNNKQNIPVEKQVAKEKSQNDAEKFCPVCGQKVEPDTEFCGVCGTKIN